MPGARTSQFNTTSKHLLHTVCTARGPPRRGAISPLQWLPRWVLSQVFTPPCFHVRGYQPCVFSSVSPLTSLPGTSQPPRLSPFLRQPLSDWTFCLLCPRPSWCRQTVIESCQDCHLSIILPGLSVSRLFLLVRPPHKILPEESS